jgi:TfoX/Sxy family transcriptional regulator of competence genes
MAYNEDIANRIRQYVLELPNVIEKKMMGGLTFMYNDKMCVGVIKDEMMCRINPNLHNNCIEKNGCRTMDFTNRPMKGYVMINKNGMKSNVDFAYWLNLAIEFNNKAKVAKKRIIRNAKLSS